MSQALEGRSPGTPATPAPFHVEAHASFGVETPSPRILAEYLRIHSVLTKRNRIRSCGESIFEQT